jgi:hypothetical protein
VKLGHRKGVHWRRGSWAPHELVEKLGVYATFAELHVERLLVRVLPRGQQKRPSVSLLARLRLLLFGAFNEHGSLARLPHRNPTLQFA